MTVDGVPAAVSPVPVRGTTTFDLPAGDHRIVLELASTALAGDAGDRSQARAAGRLGAAVIHRKSGVPLDGEPRIAI